MNGKTVVSLDIDGILYDFYEVARREAQKRSYTLIDPPCWNLVEGGKKVQDELIQAVLTDSNILSNCLYPHTLWVLNKIVQDYNVEIHVVTSRNEKKYDVTKKWLQHQKIPFVKLCCTREKAEYFMKHNCSIVIDDYFETIQKALNLNLKVATLIYPWNEDIVLTNCDKIAYADNWLDLFQDMINKGFFNR